MIDRRLIRILASYSKTFYFVDRGVQRGLIYEIGEMLERDLNKEVFITRWSSFHESIEKLNAELVRGGKLPVQIRLAPAKLATR
jgi:hypothetical protein